MTQRVALRSHSSNGAIVWRCAAMTGKLMREANGTRRRSVARRGGGAATLLASRRARFVLPLRL